MNGGSPGACPHCLRTNTRLQYGGERGEAGSFLVCDDCGYDQETAGKMGSDAAALRALPPPKRPFTMPRPRWVPLWLECTSCGQKWDDWQPMGVPIGVWAAYVRNLWCPNCSRRGNGILMRTTPLSDPPPATPEPPAA